MDDAGRLKSIRAQAREVGLSPLRTGGFALDRLWMYLMFYSIIPFVGFGDVRYSLYLCLSISLAAMTVTLFVSAMLARRGEPYLRTPALLWSAAGAMSVGTVVIICAGVFPADDVTVLMIGAGGVITGVGSAALMVGWLEELSQQGQRTMLAELALGCCLALAAGFAMLFLPPALADAGIVAAPLLSAALLFRCGSGRAADGAVGVPGATRADEVPLGRSRKTILLFVRALGGAFAFGVLAGFFDTFAGYDAFKVDDTYGMILLAVGFVAMLCVVLMVVGLRENALSHIYRLSIALMGIGCLTTLFMADANTSGGSVVFAGYEVLSTLIAICCVQASHSFDIAPARAFGLGLGALYTGELCGSACMHFAGAPILAIGLPLITMCAVLWLLASHLYLFTEIDLIDISLGELGMESAAEDTHAEGSLAAAGEREAPDAPSGDAADAPDTMQSHFHEVSNDQVCAALVERHGLSAREADVLALMLQGRTIARIQEALFISAGTVSTHMRHIYQKTGSRNKQELLDTAEALRDELREHAEV